MMIAAQLHHALASLLPADVAFAGGTLDVNGETLFDIESKVVAGAVNKRRREFRAGRAYARQALAALGCPPQPLPVGAGREVIWPRGFVGSISHSDDLCAAIVAHRDSYCGVGLDLESNRPLDDDGMRSLICRPEEKAITWSGGDAAKLLFVIKEAVFKAYYPGTGFFLEFADVLITIDAAKQSFRAELSRENAPLLAGRRIFTGGFRLLDAHLVAAVNVPCPCGGHEQYID
jgi:4'-phosphopantetheinyl transferase EntD